MAYPPTPPPNDRLNTTPMVNNHPSDHNVLADSISDVVNELGNNPKGTYADVATRLDAIVATLSPVGVPIPILAPQAPAGFVIAGPNAEASRTGAPELFALWGTKFGVGNGSTTFGIPDMSNTIVAGVGGEEWGVISGDNDGAVFNHTHDFVDLTRTPTTQVGGAQCAVVTSGSRSYFAVPNLFDGEEGTTFNPNGTTESTSDRNLPLNIRGYWMFRLG